MFIERESEFTDINRLYDQNKFHLFVLYGRRRVGKTTFLTEFCKEYLLRKNTLGDLPLLFTEIGTWWGNDPEHHTQEEIDLVAGDGSDYLFCECKWNQQPLDIPILTKLRYRADLVNRERQNTWFVLFSKSGFTQAVEKEAASDGHVLLVSLKDILAIK